MKTAITICLAPEARNGPFVFHEGLANGCWRAASHGFDAVEIFPSSADALNRAELRKELAAGKLSVAAFGTGAGWLIRNLTLTSADQGIRAEARKFIASIVELAGSFGAPAIIGSMQGRLETNQDRKQACDWFRDALDEFGKQAETHGVPLLVEPLNRYETNLFNQLGQTAQFLQTLNTPNVRILADLFHMNIEERDLAAAIRDTGAFIGHIHFADSNRRAMGFGHTDSSLLMSAIRQIGYAGYLSAEILPLPTPDEAAWQSIDTIRRLTN